jgi:hypothetical protein
MGIGDARQGRPKTGIGELSLPIFVSKIEHEKLGRSSPMATARQKPAPSKESQSAERIVEKGDIYFAYRPRLEAAEAAGLRDVQRFFMVLKPQGAGPLRLMVLGRKRLPAADAHERIRGFVDEVAKSGGAIEAEFKGYRYRTKTRGERTVAAARPRQGSRLGKRRITRNRCSARLQAGALRPLIRVCSATRALSSC